jgi:hypothetical protein
MVLSVPSQFTRSLEKSPSASYKVIVYDSISAPLSSGSYQATYTMSFNQIVIGAEGFSGATAAIISVMSENSPNPSAFRAYTLNE